MTLRKKKPHAANGAYLIDALERRLLFALAFTSSSGGEFIPGFANAFTVRTAGSSNPVITEQSSGALPAGISFTDLGNGTATFSGTPSAADFGPHLITLTAHDGISPDATQNFTLTIDAHATITSQSGTTFTVGNNNSFTFTATAVPKADFTETGALPSGVTFQSDTSNPNTSTATLSGTAAAGTEGTYPLTITATTENNVNYDFPDATQSFTLVVVGTPPAFTNANSTTFTAGTAGTFTFTTSASPTADLSLVPNNVPVGSTFTKHSDGTATLALTPTFGQEGDYALVINASNGVSPDASDSFTLHIVDPASAFTSENSATFTAGSQDVFPIGTTGPSVRSIDAGTALPSGITLTDNHDGTAVLSGSGAETPGTYPVTLEVGNGSGPDTEQMFTLTVNAQAANGGVFTSADHTTFSPGRRIRLQSWRMGRSSQSPQTRCRMG